MRWPAAMLFLALVSCLYAQEDPAEQIKDYEDSQYPAFIDAVEITPAPIHEEAEENPATPLPTLRPDILVTDPASTTTWAQVRESLHTNLEELRLSLISGGSAEEIEKKRNAFALDLERILIMAPHQAPNQQKGLDYYQKRIDIQLGFFIEQFAEGDFRRAESSEEMLRLSLEEFDYLLFQSDLDRGSSGTFQNIPEDWNPRTFQRHDFSQIIRGWSGRKLLDAYEDRLGEIRWRFEERGSFDSSRAAVEMGELARQLATRLYEVPINSRPGFQDAVLRLDVLSENLHDFLSKENKPYTRRHLRVIEDAIQDVKAYLELREEIVRNRS